MEQSFNNKTKNQVSIKESIKSSPLKAAEAIVDAVGRERQKLRAYACRIWGRDLVNQYVQHVA